MLTLFSLPRGQHSQAREHALILKVLHGILIYCLPSMSVTAWFLFRVELKQMRQVKQTANRPHLPKSRAARGAILRSEPEGRR